MHIFGGSESCTHLFNERVHCRPERPHARCVAGDGCRCPWYRCTGTTYGRTGESVLRLALLALRDGSGVCASGIASRDTRLLGHGGSLGWRSVGGCRGRCSLRLRLRLALSCWHCRRSRRGRSFTRRSAHGRDRRPQNAQTRRWVGSFVSKGGRFLTGSYGLNVKIDLYADLQVDRLVMKVSIRQSGLEDKLG